MTLRTLSRANYCEQPPKKRQMKNTEKEISSDSCDLEVAALENNRYMTRSRPKVSSPDTLFEGSALVIDEGFESEVNGQCVPDDDTEKIVEVKQKVSISKNFKKNYIKIKISRQVKSSSIANVEADDSVAEGKACPICFLVLPDSSSFTRHIREHNTNKASHICQICSKKLSSTSSLDRHMLVHSGERPFKCTICDYPFTTNGNMHRHMRTHRKFERSKRGKDESSSDSPAGIKPTSFDSGSDEASMNTEEENHSSKRRKLKDNNYSQRFKCHVCDKSFASDHLLNSHMNTHPNNPIKCPKCNRVFHNYTSYVTHTCLKDEKHQGNVSEFGFRDLNFVQFSTPKFSLIAENICAQKPRRPTCALLAFECRTCGKAFPCNRSLHLHEKTHDSNIGTYCCTCKCNFMTSYMLLKHQFTHRTTEECKKLSTKSSVRHTAEKDDFLATLGLCFRAYENEKFTVEKEKNENNCETTVEEPSIHTQENFQSESSNDFADIHKIISLTSCTQIPNMKSEERKDDQMESSFIIESSDSSKINLSEQGNEQLTENVKEATETVPEKMFPCSKCTSSFSTQKDLKSHGRCHSKSGVYKCKICNYTSLDRSTLNRHMRTHSGDRPFKCIDCNFPFTTKANAGRHVRKIHGIPKHKAASHVTYNSNIKEINSAESLSANTVTVCKHCKQDFKGNRILRHHLRSTKGSCIAKPFLCKICKMGCSTKNNCIRHIAQQHREFKGDPNTQIIKNKQPENNDIKESSVNLVNSKCLANTNQEAVLKSNGETTTEYQDAKVENFSANVLECQSFSSHEEVCQQFSCSVDDAVMIVAESLVNLSQSSPPDLLQSSPLDLSVRALDLTSKSGSSDTAIGRCEEKILEHNSFRDTVNKLNPVMDKTDKPLPAHLSPLMVRVHEGEKFADAPFSPLNLIQNSNQTSPFPTSDPMICLPQTISGKSDSITYTPNNQLIVPNISNFTNGRKGSIENSALFKAEEQKSKANLKPYQCEYCPGTFTLKSNRDRHIKKKHPEHAKPPRSRNFIPQFSNTESPKQAPLKLSDKTRDALRTVLSTKVNNISIKFTHETEDLVTNKQDIGPLANQDDGSNLTINNYNMPSQNAEVEKCEIVDMKSDLENVDLASVSSVIDTANSQVIKQYFSDTDATNCGTVTNTPVPDFSENVGNNSINTVPKEKKSPYIESRNHHCTYCKSVFQWKSSLDRHILKHTGDKPWKCQYCPLRFSTKSNHRRHLKSHNSIKKYSPCLPQRVLNLESISQKVQLHSNENERITAGSFYNQPTTSTDASYSDHLLVSETENVNSSLCPDLSLKGNGDIPNIECKFCKTTYKSEKDQINHIKELHPLEYQALMNQHNMLNDTLPWTNYNAGCSKEENQCNEITIVTCCFCLQEFESTTSLFHHGMNHSSEVLNLCKFCSKSADTKLDKFSILYHQAIHLYEQPLILIGQNGAMSSKNNVLEKWLSMIITRLRVDPQLSATELKAGIILSKIGEISQKKFIDDNNFVHDLSDFDCKVIGDIIKYACLTQCASNV